ncbi:hypothetical protein [Massilibacteroides sp.]|uniref:hypothetical protein n=1 Tax=Massilibacteroides sp. TaxID=2034766 RepID=UPI00262E6CDA|nr:hypothetical protein [Massilibacteroides sp.]MDD4514505.1 hypothetical protein [Massilibacteroides sp.]
MKKIVLMMAIIAGVAFTTQSVVALSMVSGIERVNQDEFVKIEVKDLPQTVTEAVLKANEGSTIKEAYVAGVDAEKKFKVIITDKEGQDVTLILNENGEFLS